MWQKYGVIQNVRHSGKRGGKFDKKATKNYVGGGFAAKKYDDTHLKKTRDFASDILFDADFILVYFLWVYLLMMLIAFYETNKPYISK